MGLLSHTLLGCFLAFLPGPPRIKFNNANFALFPVDKINKYCPEVEAGRDIGFYFYSRKFWKKPHELRIGDDAALSTSGFNFHLPTLIYFTPFFDGYDSMNVREVKEAFLIRGGYNFISVVSGRLNAGPWYPTAVTNTLVVGRFAAAFIDYLIDKGLPIENLHFVGLSIGAHTAGIAANFMRHGKPPRITGLDPASWLFVKKSKFYRLDETDADLVDVIHTDRIFGTWFPMGDADFFVDSQNLPQPGCEILPNLEQQNGILFTFFCSHLRSNGLFADSVIHPTNYPAFKCSNWKNLKSNICEGFSYEFMGVNVSSSARGIFYVPTKRNNNEIR